MTPFRGYLPQLTYEVVGNMSSSLSGLNSQNKGDKKKYASLNINSVYKGKGAEAQKSTGEC